MGPPQDRPIPSNCRRSQKASTCEGLWDSSMRTEKRYRSSLHPTCLWDAWHGKAEIGQRQPCHVDGKGSTGSGGPHCVLSRILDLGSLNHAVRPQAFDLATRVPQAREDLLVLRAGGLGNLADPNVA